MKRILLALLLLGGILRTAHADRLALDITEAGIKSATFLSSVLGWSFSVNSPIKVDALGVWDQGSHGLSDSHEVGLWTDAGTLLASTTVTNASTPLASAYSGGRWLSQDITDLVLEVGIYRIGAFYSTPNYEVPPELYQMEAPKITIPEVTFGNAVLVSSSSLAFPTIIRSVANPGYFGPTFLTTDAPPLPEPSSIALLALGALGLSWVRRQCKPL